MVCKKLLILAGIATLGMLAREFPALVREIKIMRM